MANKKLVSEPVDMPDVSKDATPMERLAAFARRIVRVPKDEIEAREGKRKLS